MVELTLEEKYDALEQRYDSLVKAVRQIEGTNDILAERNRFLEEQLGNAELNISQQKQTLTTVITNNNQMKDDMAAEIAELRRKINGTNN